jgi:hypothetical protein
MPRVVGVDLRRELTDNPPAGLSPVGARLRRDALALAIEEDLVEAAYCYEVLPLAAPAADGVLRVADTRLHAPGLVPERGELTALAFAACTLGPRLQLRCTGLFAEKRPSLAVALDKLGSEMLFALGRRVQDRLLSECYRKRLDLGAEINAGDPGLDLDALPTVLRLAGAVGIGIDLHRGKAMTPLKSTATVFALGRNLPAVALSRCAGCPSQHRCAYGRRVPEPELVPA